MLSSCVHSWPPMIVPTIGIPISFWTEQWKQKIIDVVDGCLVEHLALMNKKQVGHFCFLKQYRYMSALLCDGMWKMELILIKKYNVD